MIVTTTENIAGYELEILGVVSGNTVRAKNIGKDILAFFRNVFGGEILEYSEMLTEARTEAMSRMVQEAEKLRADAVVNARFATSQIMTGAAELVAYGTAVRLKKV